MPLEPSLNCGGLVGGIIVDDEMQVEIGQRALVDGLEEAEEFAMPVAGHAFADDCVSARGPDADRRRKYLI